jgi:hypothetical protein
MSSEYHNMRNLECKKYDQCLSEAAQRDTDLNCHACSEGKNPAAVSLGRLGGLKGGPARAKVLSKEDRVRIARKASMTRWGKLLDCPFCHTTDLDYESDISEIGDCAVICQTEGCIMGPIGRDKDDAISKWNG